MNEREMLVSWFNNHSEEIRAPYQPLSALVDKIKSSWPSKLISEPSIEKSLDLLQTAKTVGLYVMPKVTLTLLPNY